MEEENRNTVEIEISVKYAGKEWEDYTKEGDPLFLADSVSDLIAGIDYQVREEYKSREFLKKALRGEIEDPPDPNEVTITLNMKPNKKDFDLWLK